MQTVEIAKALANNAEVIIMDEPTSAISAAGGGSPVCDVIRDLRVGAWRSSISRTRMDEIFRIADTITVLRDGR